MGWNKSVCDGIFGSKLEYVGMGWNGVLVLNLCGTMTFRFHATNDDTKLIRSSGAGAGSARWPMALESLYHTKQRGDLPSWAASDLGDDSCWCFMVDFKKGGFIVKHPTGTNQVVVSNIFVIFAPIIGGN